MYSILTTGDAAVLDGSADAATSRCKGGLVLVSRDASSGSGGWLVWLGDDESLTDGRGEDEVCT